MVLENQVRRATSGGESLASFVASVASNAPVPGGGSVAAHIGALAAALAQMVAGLTVGRKKYAAVEAQMKDLAINAAALGARLSALVSEDAAAFTLVRDANKLPQDTDERRALRATAGEEALTAAAAVPLETAKLCAQVAELAVTVATSGNTNALSDAGVAALLAEAGAKGAAYNVRINAQSMSDRAAADALTREVNEIVQRTSELAAAAASAVEKGLASPPG
jgi:formiminotetrahydrofolate cyclodeaminase